ncbi:MULTISPECIES: DNA topology modulation protein FlaR [Amycolatopsis]|uniref:DNA topology modulation protein n=1 Tax=Amycolatopsis tucumanensis TaxID=401106 RepID=A0ABP7HUF3_9PSEU|nr:DNA topology modulation protein FlaR [Amycolatopsis tucumanensis]MCF6422534.1 DNA topology modulation protein FlaR [Amycolatopsis tucumanensis]
MRRVVVLGCGGAGKSTFSRRLGALLDLPVTHLDHVYWQPGWVPLPAGEFAARQRALVAGERWLLDGNYGGTLEIRLAAADTVILLDPPRRVCLRRAVLRVLRGWGRDGQAPGCPERLSLEFLAWIWAFRRRSRPRALRAIAEHGCGARQYLLTTPREAGLFLSGLAREKSAGSGR